jgi:hypothetical protein
MVKRGKIKKKKILYSDIRKKIKFFGEIDHNEFGKSPKEAKLLLIQPKLKNIKTQTKPSAKLPMIPEKKIKKICNKLNS